MAELRRTDLPRPPRARGSAVAMLRPIAVGLLSIAVAVAARLLLEQVSAGIAPFLLIFPVAIVGTLLAGAVAGGIALVGCQLLTLIFVAPHWTRDGVAALDAINFGLATISLALTVWATASHRRSAMLLGKQCEREVETLSLLVNEIDHRTKNNFQIAAALLHAQGTATAEPRVREELDVAGNRLFAMAAVYQALGTRGRPEARLPLLAHLTLVGAAVRESLLPAGIALEIGGDEIEVKAPAALTIGLVVNEWLTNAAKHAFQGRGGSIAVQVSRRIGGVEVTVADDGVGLAAQPEAGTGSRLMASLIAALDGRSAIRTDRGTTCILFIPLD